MRLAALLVLSAALHAHPEPEKVILRQALDVGAEALMNARMITEYSNHGTCEIIARRLNGYNEIIGHYYFCDDESRHNETGETERCTKTALLS